MNGEGSVNTLIGAALTSTNENPGIYMLSDGEGPVLTGCAVVVSLNDAEAGPTSAKASVTGGHQITVTTYGETGAKGDEPFSLMVTC